MLTVEFVKSMENISDLMMKNKQSVHFKTAQIKLVYTMHNMEEEKTEKQEQFKIHEWEGC